MKKHLYIGLFAFAMPILFSFYPTEKSANKKQEIERLENVRTTYINTIKQGILAAEKDPSLLDSLRAAQAKQDPQNTILQSETPNKELILSYINEMKENHWTFDRKEMFTKIATDKQLAYPEKEALVCVLAGVEVLDELFAQTPLSLEEPK